ncbi:MAG: Flp family type IVb pilin [Chloroflexota bacterium]
MEAKEKLSTPAARADRVLRATAESLPRQIGAGIEFLAGAQRKDSGQDVVEYAMLCALLSIIAIGLMFTLGPYVSNVFRDVISIKA